MFLAINPELEQSARTSGASWLQTMRHVVVPLLRPSLVAAWLMLFVIFIRELGATILLYAQGTETISVAMVVLSDGADNTGGVDLETISEIRRQRIPVHTIGFGREAIVEHASTVRHTALHIRIYACVRDTVG